MVDVAFAPMCRACGSPVEVAEERGTGRRARTIYCARHRYVLQSAAPWREALWDGVELLYRLRSARSAEAHPSYDGEEGGSLWGSGWHAEKLVRHFAAQCAEGRMRWKHAEIWLSLLEGLPKSRAAEIHGVSRPTVHATPQRLDKIFRLVASRAECGLRDVRDLLIAAVLMRRPTVPQYAVELAALEPGGALDRHQTRLSREVRSGTLKANDLDGWFKPVFDAGLPSLISTEDLLAVSGTPDEAFAVRRYLKALVDRGDDRLPSSWYEGLTAYFWAARTRACSHPRNAPEEYGAFLFSLFVSALKQHLSHRTHKAEAWLDVETGIAYCQFCGAPAHSAAKARDRTHHVQPARGANRCLHHLHFRRPPAWAGPVDDLRLALRSSVAHLHRPGTNSPVADWHYRQVAYALLTKRVRARDYAVGMLREEARRVGSDPPSMAEIARPLGVSRAAIAKQYGGRSNRAEVALETVRNAINYAVRHKPMRHSPHRPIEARDLLAEAVRRVLFPPELHKLLLEVRDTYPIWGTQEVHRSGSRTY